jgi:ComF family protein
VGLNLVAWARVFGRTLLDVLYPPRCVGCGQVGTFFCTACRDAVSLVCPPVCPLCGQPQELDELCHKCAQAPPAIDGIRSAARFEGPLRQAIHQFKYAYTRDLAVPLGELLFVGWRTYSPEADVIVPVPLHARREKERGYNQSELLAAQLGQSAGIPVLCRALCRVRYTASQARLDEEARRHNVRQAFACEDGQMRGKRVLLIDDVCTTGATLEACSAALKAGGARSVLGLTVARAV